MFPPKAGYRAGMYGPGEFEPLCKQKRKSSVDASCAGGPLSLANHFDMHSPADKSVGVVFLIIAIFQWIETFGESKTLFELSAHTSYPLVTSIALSNLLSSVYISLAAIILLGAKKPIAEFRQFFPRFLAISATFSAVVFALVPAQNTFNLGLYTPICLILIGTGLASVSLFFLRRAFSVTPQVREVVTRGPYAIIRHPMYAGHIFALLGLALLKGSFLALAVWLACAILQAWRAFYEETLFGSALPDEYDAYRQNVGAILPRF